jgi:hypothetical protein
MPLKWTSRPPRDSRMHDGVDAEAADTDGDGRSVVTVFMSRRALLSLDQLSERSKRSGVWDGSARLNVFNRHKERILEIANVRYRNMNLEADGTILILESDLNAR